jgi:hypothetical protein
MPVKKSSELSGPDPIVSSNSSDRQLIVKNDPEKPLPVGLNIFTLVVIDNSGNRSKVARAEVIVRDTTAPTAVIRPASQTIEFGQDFILDGSDSSDIGGQIAAYEWTLVPSPQ